MITLKNEVRSLRCRGMSLNEIVRVTGVPKSTLRGWIKDIVLTSGQLQKLNSHSTIALHEGRKSFQTRFTENRNKKVAELFDLGVRELGHITDRELFIAGVALYWAEGFKNRHEKRLGFCNSDPKMIKFYLYWLHGALGVDALRITARLSINSAHKDHEERILEYWRSVTGLPASSFTKTFYQNVVSVKQFDNRDTYNGVLRLHVKESLDILLKMRGWIEGLGSIQR